MFRSSSKVWPCLETLIFVCLGRLVFISARGIWSCVETLIFVCLDCVVSRSDCGIWPCLETLIFCALVALCSDRLAESGSGVKTLIFCVSWLLAVQIGSQNLALQNTLMRPGHVLNHLADVTRGLISAPTEHVDQFLRGRTDPTVCSRPTPRPWTAWTSCHVRAMVVLQRLSA